MTDKELKKLSRAELLEILVEQGKEIDRLRQELDDANAKLDDRRVLLEQTGSIAEASLKLNKIFETAQRAADDYVASVRLKYGGKAPAGQTRRDG